MSHGPRRLPHLPSAGAGLPVAGCPDADLLARFAGARDEAAFELLFRRHGPMVLGVCRRVLADPADAADAFQATFLVLARKAGAVGHTGCVAGWLHRVARHAALRVRADRARRHDRERPAADDLPGPPPPDPGWAELGRVLDEEVGRLPARHRAAFVLCCLEGKTGEEAARVLGCPTGTVSSRLTRARERLRARLTRRGFAPAAVAAALAAGPPAVSARLADTSLAAALAFAAGRPSGPPSRPAATAEGVIRTMFLHKAQLAALLLVGGALAAGGLLAGAAAQPAPADPPPAKADDAKVPANPVAVKLVRPTRGGLDRVVAARAIAEPVQRADLFPAVVGRVKTVAVDVGDKVKAGQVLAEIDAPDAALDVRQAEAGLLQAEAKLREAEVRVGIARSELDVVKELGKQKEADAAAARVGLAHRKAQYERTRQLHATGAMTAEQLDEAGIQLRAAEVLVATADAAVKAAGGAEMGVRTARLALAEAGVGTARADIEAARVSLDRARLVLARVRVTAPFDGVVARRNAWPGDATRPDAAAGRPPLFTLSQVSAVRVALSVPSIDLPRVEVGAPAEVAFDAFPGQPFTGKVGRIAPDVDPATGKVRVEIDVPNPGGKVLPGMSGDARVATGKAPADALRVPITALLPAAPGRADRTTHRVYVVRGGTARLTPVRVAYAQGTEAEVTAGLTADDLVVADPGGLQGDAVPVRTAPQAPR